MSILKMYLLVTAFIIKQQGHDIDKLFYRWNLATLNSINEGLNYAIDPYERALFDNRLNTMITICQIESDSLNKKSTRWKLLSQIEKDFNRSGKSWTVIETMKSGERVRFTSYLIEFDNFLKKIIRYDYTDGIWVKNSVTENSDINIEDFKTKRRELGTGGNTFDIIVTNFNSSSILQSTYFLNSTLPNKSKIYDVISSY